jgi:hypothetical protein
VTRSMRAIGWGAAALLPVGVAQAQQAQMSFFAMVGHHDRIGPRDDDASKSWNSSHPSPGPDGGCSQADLRSTGGDGLLYGFAAN